MTDVDAWIKRNADQLALTLADPAVRAELLALLSGDDERHRQRRLEAARRKLASPECAWPLPEGEPDGL